jgi:epsilon-lactone hydrolase
MASPEATAIHDLLRELRQAPSTGSEKPTIEEQRASAERTMSLVGVMPEGVAQTEIELAARRALQFDPVNGSSAHVVLQFHGGAYSLYSIDSHAKVSAAIAQAGRCRVISFDYRLAPEHPFPAAVDDGLAAYRALLDDGVHAENIVITGDSAGGGLTIATCLAARAAGLPQPAATVTFSPWTDLEGTGESSQTMVDKDLMIDPKGIALAGRQYLQGADPRHPLASVIYADLAGLAPMYIQVGGHETLLDDSTRLATRAAHAGVSVRLDVFPEMQHVFQAMVGLTPECADAIDRMGAYIRDLFAASVAAE